MGFQPTITLDDFVFFFFHFQAPAHGKKSKKVNEVQKISRNEQAKSPNKKETAQLKSKTPNAKEKNKGTYHYCLRVNYITKSIIGKIVFRFPLRFFLDNF